MCENPPDWAKERAQLLIINACIPGEHYAFGADRAFARYIAEHEEPPVDPLLIEARNLCCKRYSTDDLVQKNLRSGKYDDHFDVMLALEALRRGIELAGPRGEEQI